MASRRLNDCSPYTILCSKWSLTQKTDTWIAGYGEDLTIGFIDAVGVGIQTPRFMACSVTNVVSTPVGAVLWVLFLQIGDDIIPETTTDGDTVSVSTCVYTSIYIEDPFVVDPPPPTP